jgi:Bacterial membrane protein YfhO
MMRLFHKLKAEAGPAAVIVAFFIAFFWPAFFSGMCFVGADSLVYFYPTREAAWDMIRDGALPLWMPHILSGFPLLAMVNLGIGYPLTWVYLFLPGHIAEEVYVLAPYLLAPAFVYAYLRTVNCSRLGSLLGGLSFTYGGLMVSGLGQCGQSANAVMWLPLMLIAIERARTGRFILCLVGAGAAYAMSVLTGLGQMFVYVGLIAVLGLKPKAEFIATPGGGNSRLSRLFRLRPLAVGLGGIAIGAGVGAFQIFETMQAHRLSQRREMTYEAFSFGSFGPSTLWHSFINPIYIGHYEVSAYVAPLAVIFGLVAVVAVTWSSEQRLRVYFWLLVAVLGLLLIMGDYTPLYRLLYYIPVINKFRHPWRHTYEWTLGASMLAAFGWDAAARFFTRAVNDKDAKTLWRWRNELVGSLLLVSCVAATIVLVWPASRMVRAWVTTSPTGMVALAKLAYTLLLLVAMWWGWRKMSPAGGKALSAVIIMSACFWEQHLWASGWWFPQNKPASTFAQASPSARFLDGRAPVDGRIYTSLIPWGSPDFRRYEPHNLPARHGFHNAAGYEPLASRRYCQVFGDCSNYVTPTFEAPPDPQILDTRWQGLDLLNVRFVIQPPPPLGWAEKDGERFASADAGFNLAPGASATLGGASAEADTLSLVTMTANSTLLPQGSVVAYLTVHTADGRRIEREIKVGIDTAEWAYERPDVKPVIRHSLPRVYDSLPGEGFPHLRYWTKFDLGMKTAVDSVELRCAAEGVTLTVFKATLYDSSGVGAFLLAPRPPAHWRKVYDYDATQIYENPRALPRAWMVPRAEVVSAEESLRRVRGESRQPFDPRETALLELDDKSRPELPQGDFKTPPETRIVSYEPNRLAIETVADKSAVLVASEVNYPGWEATIDGQPAKVLTADYLLRGVVVPEGKHRVEMRYTAPAAQRGAIISALTLLALICGAIFSTRSSWKQVTRHKFVDARHLRN